MNHSPGPLIARVRRLIAPEQRAELQTLTNSLGVAATVATRARIVLWRHNEGVHDNNFVLGIEWCCCCVALAAARTAAAGWQRRQQLLPQRLQMLRGGGCRCARKIDKTRLPRLTRPRRVATACQSRPSGEAK